MKKYITFILVFMMIAVASVSCFAAETQSLVVDNAGLLSETERQSLEARLLPGFLSGNPTLRRRA